MPVSTILLVFVKSDSLISKCFFTITIWILYNIMLMMTWYVSTLIHSRYGWLHECETFNTFVLSYSYRLKQWHIYMEGNQSVPACIFVYHIHVHMLNWFRLLRILLLLLYWMNPMENRDTNHIFFQCLNFPIKQNYMKVFRNENKDNFNSTIGTHSTLVSIAIK